MTTTQHVRPEDPTSINHTTRSELIPSELPPYRVNDDAWCGHIPSENEPAIWASDGVFIFRLENAAQRKPMRESRHERYIGEWAGKIDFESLMRYLESNMIVEDTIKTNHYSRLIDGRTDHLTIHSGKTLSVTTDSARLVLARKVLRKYRGLSESVAERQGHPAVLFTSEGRIVGLLMGTRT